MDKQELKERLKDLPKFELRAIQTSNSTQENNEWTLQENKQAVVDIETNKAYSYVSNNYQLIQFSEIFGPIIDSIEEEISGYLIHNGGYAILKGERSGF